MSNKEYTKPKNSVDLIFLGAVITLISIIRYRLISIPFERDEGEYGYIGSLLLHGLAPYKDAYSMKLPGTSFMYALFMLVFGRSSNGVHLGVMAMNAATMLVLYVAFKKLFSSFVGLVTATVFGFMAIGGVFEGFAAHATQFICFYSALAFLFFSYFINSGKALTLFLCGLMLGMAFIMKQQAVFMIAAGGFIVLIYLKNSEKNNISAILKKLTVFGAGVFIPYFIVLLIIIVSGQFQTFWLWTVEYASKYEVASNNPVAYFMSTFSGAWKDYFYFWVLSAGGIIVLFLNNYSRFQKTFVILFFIGSVATLSSGLYFRGHYFSVAFPAIGLLIGVFIEYLINLVTKKTKRLKANNIGIAILLVIIALNVYFLRYYYFIYTPTEIANVSYSQNPFIPAKDIADYIKHNTTDTDKIAVLGSEPEIYFYSGRKAATGYLYTYPLVEDQPYNLIMQNEMISEIEKNKPKYLTFCNCTYSWVTDENAPKKIFDWSNNYINQYYTLVGFTYFSEDNRWVVLWGADMNNLTGKPQTLMYVFRRKTG